MLPYSSDRGEQLIQRRKAEVYRETDQLLSRVLLVEWAVLLIIALLGASEIWSGDSRSVDPHVWNVLIFGGAITLVPIVLARVRSGGLSLAIRSRPARCCTQGCSSF